MTFDIKLNMKLDAFFSQYTQAFDALSAESIAELYRLPCATSDGDGVNVYSDRQSLIEKFAGNCEAMKGFGYQKSMFRILEQQDLGEGKVSVNIAWRITTAGGNVDFRSLYICHKLSGDWRIFSANVYPGQFESE